jgi:hypothetical protein
MDIRLESRRRMAMHGRRRSTAVQEQACTRGTTTCSRNARFRLARVAHAARVVIGFILHKALVDKLSGFRSESVTDER